MNLKENEAYKIMYKIYKAQSHKQSIYKFGIQIPQNMQHLQKFQKMIFILGLISIETIRVAFGLAAMNQLDVCAADVSTAFFYGKTMEKDYFIAGEEFGEHRGKGILIDKGLYGLASAAVWVNDELSSTLRNLGF